jgi:5-methylcytosine-specific restriction endonuclease McrA
MKKWVKKGRHQNSNTSFKGKKHSAIAKIKMREAAKLRKGEINSNWRGGISKVTNLVRTSTKYMQWRQDVFVRDDFTCRKCGKRGGDIHAHHKKSFLVLFKESCDCMPLFSKYDAAMHYSPLWDIENGETLCVKCHRHKKRPERRKTDVI